MELIAAGMTNQQIAATCFISEKTVKNHINRIFAKLQATSRSAGHRPLAGHREGTGGDLRRCHPVSGKSVSGPPIGPPDPRFAPVSSSMLCASHAPLLRGNTVAWATTKRISARSGLRPPPRRPP